MTKFYFDIRDVFRAPRLALSGKKILLQFMGLLIGYLGFLLFSYIAFLSAGSSFKETWQYHGLFPVGGFPFIHWYSWVIFGIGCLFALVCWLLASAMVGKITYEQLKGDDFYSSKEALRFLKKNWAPVLLSPFSLLAFIAFLIICGIVVGLLGKIPYVGEIGFSIFYLIPLFAAALFLAYVIFIFVFSLLLAPAIVATTKEDTFETIVQTFSVIWNQAWRYFLYTGLLGVMAKVGTFILGYFSFGGVKLLNFSCGILMKDKLADILEEALSYITVPTHFLNYFSNIFPGIKFSFSLPEIGPGVYLHWSGEISAFIIGISLIFILFMVTSYGLAILSSGQVLTYIILRKKKDDENLLERKTEMEEEEERREAEQKAKEKKEEETEPEEKLVTETGKSEEETTP
jgi:membrane protein implicated in regulation of membrane protease activity